MLSTASLNIDLVGVGGENQAITLDTWNTWDQTQDIILASPRLFPVCQLSGCCFPYFWRGFNLCSPWGTLSSAVGHVRPEEVVDVAECASCAHAHLGVQVVCGAFP